MRTTQTSQSSRSSYNYRLALFIFGTATLANMGIAKNLPEPMVILITHGVLNFFDVSEFFRAFANYEPTADFTLDNTWDFFDISEFLIAFADGCP